MQGNFLAYCWTRVVSRLDAIHLYLIPYECDALVGMVFRCRSKWLAKLSDPWVRLVDPLVGEAVGMRVDVDLEDGTTAAGVYVHKKLSDCVG